MRFSLILLAMFVMLLLLNCSSEKQESADEDQASSTAPGETGYSLEDFKQLSWMTTDWVRSGRTRDLHESWRPDGEGRYVGIGYYIGENGDSTVMEQLALEFAEGEIHYIPTVAHNQGPVIFKLIEFSI